MKEKILNSKGISLVSLSIAVVIMLIITGMVIYNIKDNLKVEKLEQMQQDIEILKDKVDTYYAQYGTIPAKFDAEYTSINYIREAGLISDAVDTGKFYVIDLQSIENLTLTFGQDYEAVKTLTGSAQISQYTNLYIINEDSHNIFYSQGIEIDNEFFYTNYTSEDIDKEAVKLKYVGGVKIPEGYIYESGTKEDGIIIVNEETDEQYEWILLEDEIDELPEGVTVEDEVAFLKSANLFGGYYQSVDDETIVVTLPIEEKWSPVYDKNVEYVDENGDTAIIPAGFKVSRTSGMDTIYEGLVIQDEEGNEFVWVPVSKENFETEFVRRDYGNQNIADANFVSGGPTDNKYAEYAGDGINVDTTASKTEQEAQKMYKSVKENGGFYIGRYETGVEGVEGTISGNIEGTGEGIRGTAVSKKGAYVYNEIGWSNSNTMTVEKGGAVEVARSFAGEYDYETVTSTLVYGVQWDAVMRWISTDESLNGYLKDSSSVGNYSDSDSTINPAKTGTVEEYQLKNIYDMAGNVYEWTMEARNNIYRVTRGGYYASDSGDRPVSYRRHNSQSSSISDIGFRIALYIE